MIATIVIVIALILWLGYVAYRRFFDKKHPIGSCGEYCNDCNDALCHLDFVKEYRRDQAREKRKEERAARKASRKASKA